MHRSTIASPARAPRADSLARAVLLGLFALLLIPVAVVAMLLAQADTAQAAGTTIAVNSSSFARAANGFLTYNVKATFAGYSAAGQPCGSGSSCIATLEVQHSNSGAAEALSSVALDGTSPSAVTFSSSLNTTKITGWRISIYGGTTYSGAWTAVTDPYSTTAATINTGFTLTRLANGYANWNVAGKVSGYSQPDQVCGNASTCNVMLEAKLSDGSTTTLASTTVNYGSDYPTPVSFSGTLNLLKISSIRLSIYGNGTPNTTYSGAWTAVTDPYSTTAATINTGFTLTRLANGYANWNVAGKVSGYSQPDQVCGNASTCNVMLEAKLSDGSTTTLASTTVNYGSDYPTPVSFSGALNLLKISSIRLSIYGNGTPNTTYSGAWTAVTDPYSTTAATINTGFTLTRLANGYANWNVTGRFSGFSQPDQVCGNASLCYVELDAKLSDGSITPISSDRVSYGADYPAPVTFSGSDNLLKISSLRVAIYGNGSSVPAYSGAWTAVTDPYSTTAATINTGFTLTRLANGYANWNVTGKFSGFSQPDQVCGNASLCYVELDAKLSDGSITPISSDRVSYGADYPAPVTFSGSDNLLKISSLRVAIYGNGSSVPAYSGAWTAVTDPYPPQSATVVARSSSRDGSDQLTFDVDGRVSGFSQPDRPCGSGTCYASLEGKGVDGSVTTLSSANLSYAYGMDYPVTVSLAGAATAPQLVAWRVSLYGNNTTFAGPWKSLADITQAERRSGSNAAENACGCQHADPVDSSTGSFNETVTDLALPGVGPALSLQRSYSSTSAASNGAFGYGWAANLGMALSFPSAGSAAVAQENGAVVPFTKNADGSFTAPARVIASLTYNTSNATYTYLRRGVEKFVFNTTGQLMSSADLNGNTVTLGRNASGNVTTMTGSGGRTITLSWAGGVITGATDSAGRSTTYTYDGSGNLATITAADGAVTAYTYDASHGLLTMTLPGGGVTTNAYNSDETVASQTDPVGRVTTFSYSGGVTTIVKPSGTKVVESYVNGLLMQQVIDADGAAPRTTTYSYDDSNNLVSTVDALGNTTSATFDGQGNVVTQTNALGKVSKFTFNTLNEVLTSTDPLNRVTTATYNATGQQLTAVDAAGKTKSWTYNADGTVASLTDTLGKTTSYTYTSTGLPAGATDPDARVRSVTYTPAGFVKTETDAAGKVTTYTRDALGRQLTVKDPDNNITTDVYDADGNLTKVTDPRGHNTTAVYDAGDQKTSSTDPNGNTTSYTYAANGQVATLTDPRGNVTTNGYDSFDQVVSVKDPGNRTTSSTYDAAGRTLTTTLPTGAVSKSGYDAAGQVTTTTDALGKITKYTYDAAGQQISSTDPLNRVTQQTFSSTGLPTVKTLPGTTVTTETTAYDAAGQQTGFTNADGLTTSYVWDPAGLLTSKTEPGTMTTSYTYDTAGRQKTVTTPDSHVTTNTYSDAGRLTRVHSDVTGSTDITYSWDANGNRASMTDATGTSTYTYDNGDRLTAATNGAGKALAYGYNTADDLTTITYPGNKTATYGYDTADRMTSVKDWANRTSTFTWTNNNQLLTQKYANGVTETRTYDTAGQLKQAKDVNSASTALGTYGYTYDAAGQLSADTSNDPLGTTVAHTYTYDTTSQLASIAGSGTTGPVTATPGGQLTKTPAAGTLAYNSKQQITSSTPATGTAISYTYNNNGARITATTGSSATGYSYTGFGDLATATLPTKTITYTSNGDDLRQTRTTGGATKQLLWNTNGALPLLLDDGDQTYLYGPTSTPIAQIDSAGTVQYLHTDLLGTPRLITSSTGAVVASMAYSAYGTPTGKTGTANSNIGYTGNWTDPDTALIYLRARDYDPNSGQFLTIDPAVDLTHDSYAYVDNNALVNTDPSGLITIGGCFSLQIIVFNLGNTGEVCLVAALRSGRYLQLGATATEAGFTPGTGANGTPSLGASAVVQKTNADTISQLGGYSLGIGGSRGDRAGGVFVGEDAACLPGGRVIGQEAGLSAGLPKAGEIHAQRTLTYTWHPVEFDLFGGFIPPVPTIRGKNNGITQTNPN